MANGSDSWLGGKRTLLRILCTVREAEHHKQTCTSFDQHFGCILDLVYASIPEVQRQSCWYNDPASKTNSEGGKGCGLRRRSSKIKKKGASDV